MNSYGIAIPLYVVEVHCQVAPVIDQVAVSGRFVIITVHCQVAPALAEPPEKPPKEPPEKPPPAQRVAASSARAGEARE